MWKMGRYLRRTWRDLELTDAFMEMGVDELSVAPSMVLKVRKNIREYTAN